MSANLGAHSVKGGFNQSGGAMFMVLADLEPGTSGTTKYVYTMSAAPTGSGGATTAPTFALTTMSNVLKGSGVFTTSYAAAADLVDSGKLIKDMGKSVVGANGRTYRKFAVAATGAAFVSSLGVVGNGAATPNTGYGSFYLEVGREGFADSTTGPAPIVRYG